MKKEELKDKLFVCKSELKRYKKGYNIMMCYFDSISDEERPKVNKKLKKLGI